MHPVNRGILRQSTLRGSRQRPGLGYSSHRVAHAPWSLVRRGVAAAKADCRRLATPGKVCLLLVTLRLDRLCPGLASGPRVHGVRGWGVSVTDLKCRRCLRKKESGCGCTTSEPGVGYATLFDCVWLMLTIHILFRRFCAVCSCAAVYLGRRLTLPTEGGQPQGIASIRRCLRRHQAGPARPHQTSGRRRGAKPTRTRGRRGPLSEDT